MKQQLLVLVLALFSISLQAADIRYYDVEVIIFENLQADNRNSERWPQQLEREIPEKLIEIGGEWPGGWPEEYDPTLSFKPLPENEWRLASEAEKIAKSESRRLMLHKAWVQPGLPREQAISVHINQPVITPQEAEDSEISTAGQNLPAATLDSGTLDALIRVSLARYLRVETDLLFTLDQPPEEQSLISGPEPESEAENLPVPHYFHVQELRRRIRSTELHYLDHPVLGMLIMFTPHETADEAAAKKK